VTAKSAASIRKRALFAKRKALGKEIVPADALVWEPGKIIAKRKKCIPGLLKEHIATVSFLVESDIGMARLVSMKTHYRR
jgi:hypothetical protein